MLIIVEAPCKINQNAPRKCNKINGFYLFHSFEIHLYADEISLFYIGIDLSIFLEHSPYL